MRTTRAVDIIMDLRKKDIASLSDALRKDGFDVMGEDIRDAIKEKGHFTIFDTRSDYHIDAKGCYGGKERRSLKDRKAVELWGIRIFIASPEDTVANKLVFGSEQDIRDAEGIYVRQMEKLDLNYLEEICRKMGVSEDLEKLEQRVRKSLEEDDRKPT